jgi:hypothetical protein
MWSQSPGKCTCDFPLDGHAVSLYVAVLESSFFRMNPAVNILGAIWSHPMELNEIQKTILKWITDKYAATDIIRQNVCDELGRTVSDHSFSSALLGLHSARYVTSHIYDNQTESYVSIITPDEYLLDALHWHATEKAG